MKRPTTKAMTPDVGRAVRDLGSHLQAARLARNVKAATLAARANIGIATLKRMEAGDGAVSIARWAACFDALGLLTRFTETVAPQNDAQGELLRSAQRRRRAKDKRDDDDDF